MLPIYKIDVFGFIVYIVYSFIIYYVGWFNLMEVSGLETTSFQNPLVTDTNYYLYLSIEIANSNFSNIEIANSTWLSQGVTLYGAIIYYITGTTWGIFFANKMLFFVSIITLFNSLDFSKSKRIFFWTLIIFIPYFTYYNSILSKEALSFYLICFLIFTLKKKNFYSFFLFVVIFFFVRLNLLALLLLSFSLYYLLINKKYFVLLGSTVLFLVFSQQIYEYVGVYNFLERFQSNITRSADGFRGDIANFFGPTNLFKLIFLSPFRALIWYFSPLPLIKFDLTFLYSELSQNNWRVFFTSYINIFRYISAITLFILFVKRPKKYFNFNRITVFFWALIFVVSTNSFIMGARYRSMIEPFALVIFLNKKSNERIFNFRRPR